MGTHHATELRVWVERYSRTNGRGYLLTSIQWKNATELIMAGLLKLLAAVLRKLRYGIALARFRVSEAMRHTRHQTRGR